MDTLERHDLSVQSTLVEIIQSVPAAMDVFEANGIDYACRGLTPLRTAAADAGVTAEKVLRVIASPGSGGTRLSFQDESIATLVRHLVADHRKLFQKRAVSIGSLLESSAATDGKESDAARATQLWKSLMTRMKGHADAEERELFPLVMAIESFANGEGDRPTWRISQLVLREHLEHQKFCASLRELSELTRSLPESTGDELTEELRRFRADAHYHMHLENNVLYPRALELENSFRDGVRREAKALRGRGFASGVD